MTPRLLKEPRSNVVAVVDVLRATSSMITMFEQGLLRAMIGETLRDARQLALRNFSLLCGEAKALPMAGFDYGNSPAEFAGVQLKGKSAVLWTTNGTRAFKSVGAAPFVAAGALLNRAAVAERLLSEANRRSLDISIVCAGTEQGTAFSLEDTVCAGAIVEVARERDGALALADDAWAALHLWQFYRGDAERVFRQSAHGRLLRELGFTTDLDHAAQVDHYGSVPQMFDEDGVRTLRLRPRADQHRKKR
jgi:2-phosphosulfolactate phosphatase